MDSWNENLFQLIGFDRLWYNHCELDIKGNKLRKCHRWWIFFKYFVLGIVLFSWYLYRSSAPSGICMFRCYFFRMAGYDEKPSLDSLTNVHLYCDLKFPCVYHFSSRHLVHPHLMEKWISSINTLVFRIPLGFRPQGNWCTVLWTISYSEHTFSAVMCFVRQPGRVEFSRSPGRQSLSSTSGKTAQILIFSAPAPFLKNRRDCHVIF